VKYETTEWFKYLDLDEEGKPLSPTHWRVTLPNGTVYKSKGYDNAEMELNEKQPRKSYYQIKIT
jgi:hypothetical protein